MSMKPEIENLNMDDLDIEELEHRIELASANPTESLVDAIYCGTDCGTLIIVKEV